jgi:cytochrome c
LEALPFGNSLAALLTRVWVAFATLRRNKDPIKECRPDHGFTQPLDRQSQPSVGYGRPVRRCRHVRLELELQTLMQRNNCTACHLIDKRKYGPNFNEVAIRYAADSAAVTKIAARIRAGGSGVWGEDMMPPQPNVSEADARTMAELVLALKP